MRRAFLMLALVLLMLCAPNRLAAQQPIERSVKLNGGLVGHMIKIGHSRSRSSVAVTFTLENTSSNTAYLLQAGVSTITDNLGHSYTSSQSSGIGYCNSGVGGEAEVCLGLGNGGSRGVPLQSFTRVDPGRTITINVTFGTGDVGPAVAFTMNVEARFVADPDRDALVDDRVKYRLFSLINVGFLPIPIQEQ